MERIDANPKYKLLQRNEMSEPKLSVEQAHALLQTEMHTRMTEGIPVKSGDGWTAHVLEKYDAPHEHKVLKEQD